MAETDHRAQVLANLKCLYPCYDTDILTLSYPCTTVPKGTAFQAVAIKYNDNGSSSVLLYGVADSPTRTNAMQTLLRKTEDGLFKLLGKQTFDQDAPHEAIILNDGRKRDFQVGNKARDPSSEPEDFEFISSTECTHVGQASNSFEVSTTFVQQSTRILPAGAPDPAKLEEDWAFWVGAYLQANQANECKEPLPAERNPPCSMLASDVILPLMSSGHDEGKDNWAFYAAAHLSDIASKGEEDDCKNLVKESLRSNTECLADAQYSSTSTEHCRQMYPPGSTDDWAHWASQHCEMIGITSRYKATKLANQKWARDALQNPSPCCYPQGSDDRWAYWAAKHIARQAQGELCDLSSETVICMTENQVYVSPPDSHDKWAFWAMKDALAKEARICSKFEAPRIKSLDNKWTKGSAPLPDPDDDWAYWVGKHSSEQKNIARANEGNCQINVDMEESLAVYPPGCGDTWAYWVSNHYKTVGLDKADCGPNPKDIQDALTHWTTYGVPSAKLKKLQELISEEGELSL